MLRRIGVTCALYARAPSGRPIGRETPMNRIPIAAGIAAASAHALLAPAPAFAAPPIIDHWSDHIEHIEQVEHAPDWCPDVPFDVLYTEDAHGTFRFVQHGDGNYYGASSITSNFSWTNVETGKTMIASSHGNDKDVLVTDNGDGTVTIDVLDTGPTKYYDDDVKPALHRRGPNVATIVIDTGGTPSDPSDDEFVGFLGADVKGHFDTADRDFCDDIMAFIG